MHCLSFNYYRRERKSKPNWNDLYLRFKSNNEYKQSDIKLPGKEILLILLRNYIQERPTFKQINWKDG